MNERQDSVEKEFIFYEFNLEFHEDEEEHSFCISQMMVKMI